MIKFPEPKSSVPEFLSPTAANDLLACPYRLAWRLDPAFKNLRRPNTWVALGIIAHGVVEEAARGLLVNVGTKEVARKRVEVLWEDLAGEAEHDLEVAWRPMHPPPPREWPGYHLTRTRVIRRCLRQWERSGVITARSVSALQIEEAMSDGVTGIAGRPDRVEGPSGNRCVVDLKTGLRQERPTETQRRQLLMYAHLVARTSGDLPARIAIEDASGRRWEEPIDAREVDDAVQEVRRGLKQYRASVEHNSLKLLASPGADTCGWCNYKSVCEPYWNNLDASWGHGSVAGVVASVDAAPSGSLLEIMAESPVDATGTWLVSSTPADTPGVGAAISVTEAEITEAPQQLRFRWFTNLVEL
ncbi:MAG: RecB family exonuclease [Actinomycetota bacterium]